MTNHLYNSKKILEIYSITNATLHRRLSAGQIPQPIQINGRNYWSAEVIEKHLSEILGNSNG